MEKNTVIFEKVLAGVKQLRIQRTEVGARQIHFGRTCTGIPTFERHMDVVRGGKCLLSLLTRDL